MGQQQEASQVIAVPLVSGQVLNLDSVLQGVDRGAKVIYGLFMIHTPDTTMVMHFGVPASKDSTSME